MNTTATAHSSRTHVSFPMPFFTTIAAELRHGLMGAPHSFGFPANAVLPISLNASSQGMEPDISLNDTFKSSKLEERLNFVGMVPMRSLFDRSRTCKAGRLARTSGRLPEILQEEAEKF